MLGWFDARRATEVGITLADQFSASPPRIARAARKSGPGQPDKLRELLKSAERAIPPLRLNFYKKAKLANAFKWRLVEKGVDGGVAAELTQSLVMHLSMARLTAVGDAGTPVQATATGRPRKGPELLARANQCLTNGEYAEAVASFEAFLALHPRDCVALTNLGVTLAQLGRYQEAEVQFRNAIRVREKSPDAYGNLGNLLRRKGDLGGAEKSCRRALQLKPDHLNARLNLGLTLASLGRPEEAKQHLDRVLKIRPTDEAALLGMGEIAAADGDFLEAESLYRRVLEKNPDHPEAWSSLVGLRKMTPADAGWLKHAEEILTKGITPEQEASLRYAMGKYCDDVGSFARAFDHYRRANEIRQVRIEAYDAAGHGRFVDDLIRVYTREVVAAATAVEHGLSDSRKPVFVVGMPRSGTSLAEQIIAAHPSAAGAGELPFWNQAIHAHEAAVRQAPLDISLRRKLADSYLLALDRHSADALRIVDKAPINSDYLGLIHSALPAARIIYMRRDPIDTCLSCYFQQFAANALSFSVNLDALAHYYRLHHRLMQHWRAVLPAGAILDVPYAELVTDQERWTRKILDFVGLEWNEQCLSFHNVKRTVATASAWQVRQKIYRSSVRRWRHYKEFLGPLKALEQLD